MASVNRQTQENLLNEYLLVITNILQEIETDIRDIINLITETHNKLTQLDFVPVEQIIVYVTQIAICKMIYAFHFKLQRKTGYK